MQKKEMILPVMMNSFGTTARLFEKSFKDLFKIA